MTDLERFLELYKNFGIELKSESVSGWGCMAERASRLVVVMDEHCAYVVLFDKDGKFVGHDQAV